MKEKSIIKLKGSIKKVKKQKEWKNIKLNLVSVKL
jgi:hypothetical protein